LGAATIASGAKRGDNSLDPERDFAWTEAMDTQRFDTLTRLLTTATPRRGLLAGLAGGLLAARSFASGINDAEAKDKKKGKRKKTRKNKNKNKNKQGGRPATRADATCAANPGLSSLSLTEDQRIAQTFTATANGTLVRADLVISKTADSTGDFILQLVSLDANSVPTNEALASTSLPNADVPPGELATVSFDFASPATVAAGSQYALVFSRPGPDFTRWHGQFGDSCDGESFFSQGPAPSAFDAVETGFDLNFTTFVRS
jgi:hypothetical protein